LTEMKSAMHITSVRVTEGWNGIKAATLARNFGIRLDTAQWTLKVTTQQGVRSMLNPTLSQWFRTNDQQLQYRCPPVDMYTDTMFSKIKSKHGNTCAQASVCYCWRMDLCIPDAESRHTKPYDCCSNKKGCLIRW
jgi:hypothetical protein